MKTKIRLHYLLGDVHLGGHDVHRIAKVAKKILAKSSENNVFEVLTVCDEPGLGDVNWDDYFKKDLSKNSDAFIFNCGNYRFNTRAEQEILENAVSNGAGFLLMHGDHPCYWAEVGMKPWKGFEKMSGYVWREATSHGDFGNFRISINTQNVHPIMQGLSDFDTRDEIFCGLENPHNVLAETLAFAYSDQNVISRHGHSGTGRMESVVSVGQFGKGRTFNMGLGHVWPFYTGHGLGENTMISWQPYAVRIMFARACEWIATGEVVLTKDFDGFVKVE